MIVINIKKKSPFYSCVKDGRLYFKIPLPQSSRLFTPADIYKKVLINCTRYEEASDVIDKIYTEIVEIINADTKQYIVCRECAICPMQQFKD